MKKTGNKILTVQDLSCAGQCSLTVALPILSAFGQETCVLPTALLSEHTMFKHFTFLDLAENMKDTLESWKKDGHRFAAFYTGYLGKKEHFAIVERAMDELSEPSAPVIIDPAFGDNGKLYPLFDEEYVDGMRKFVRRADVILPNITEACYLAKKAYEPPYDRAALGKLIEALAPFGDYDIVLKGVEEGDKIGFAYFDRKTGETFFYLRKKMNGMFHGTGDIFASVFTGAYLAGNGKFDSAKAAAEFVALAISVNDEGHAYGVQFEKELAAFALPYIQ